MVETRKARPFSVYCCEILVVAPGEIRIPVDGGSSWSGGPKPIIGRVDLRAEDESRGDRFGVLIIKNLE